MTKPLIPTDILMWIEATGTTASERLNMAAECALKGNKAFRAKMRELSK